MRVLIAPDKYKGTMSAAEAAGIVASVLGSAHCILAPMADGGEGTAYALCNGKPGWHKSIDYYVNNQQRMAVIDSSAVIGSRYSHLLTATSAPLGFKVKDIIDSGVEKVLIGVGGTMTCDGGEGFLQALGTDKLERYRNKIVGICDVEVPLLPPEGSTIAEMQTLPSALMFAKQKGATEADYPLLWQRLRSVQLRYGRGKTSPFDGGGGGLGFAIATAIGAECKRGARFVLESYNVDWENIDLVITGEGCYDAQSLHGKVVGEVAAEALAHGIPCIAICGKVETLEAPPGLALVDCSRYLADSPLSPEVARRRLHLAAQALLV